MSNTTEELGVELLPFLFVGVLAFVLLVSLKGVDWPSFPKKLLGLDDGDMAEKVLKKVQSSAHDALTGRNPSGLGFNPAIEGADAGRNSTDKFALANMVDYDSYNQDDVDNNQTLGLLIQGIPGNLAGDPGTTLQNWGLF